MTTKYYSNNNRPNPYADAPIPISTSEDDYEEEIICLSCRCNTVIRGEDDDFCTRCQRTFNVKQVETADIVESESMDSHNETLIANLPDALDAYNNRKKVEPQGAFAELQRKGSIRITSYTERSGSGQVTRSYSNSSGNHISSPTGLQRRSAPGPTRPTSNSNSDSEESE
jgi:hypothetical protein